MAAQDRTGLFRFLKFDPNLRKSLFAKYLANPRLVILLLFSVILIGAYSYASLPRELNPTINIPIVLVSTVLPGASPADVESLVTVPIEDSINSLEKVKTVSSTSQDNVSIVTVEFQSGTDPDKAKNDVKSAVDGVSTLPTDALAPQVLKLDFQNAPVWTFVLTTSADDGSLFKFAKNLQKKVEDLPEIDKVDIAGLEDTEVQITINPESYAAYNVNPIQLSSIITSSLKSFPAGSVRTENSTFSLTIDPQATTVDDLRNLQIALPGPAAQTVALSDIATIVDRPKPSQGQSFIAYPHGKVGRAVTFAVHKTSATNINTAVTSAKRLVDSEVKNTSGVFRAVTLINTQDEIDKQFRDLTRDFLITVILVVLVLFIFLGPRQALVSSLSAPLSFLITFIVMKQSGITLNFLSLFSLILSLGLLVDDTVVVISAVSAYHKTNRFSPYETGLLVWRDFLTPVFTTTVTTVWAFLPLLLSTGIIGEFIKSIPIVVSTALAGSFIVAMFITLPLTVIFLRPQIPERVTKLIKILAAIILVAILWSVIPKGKLFIVEIIALIVFIFVIYSLRSYRTVIKQRVAEYFVPKNHRQVSFRTKIIRNIFGRDYSEGVISFDKINAAYKQTIEKILSSGHNRRMVITMVIIFSLFSFLLLPLGLVKNEFFPKTDQNIVYLTLELPAGTQIGDTKKEALKVLTDLKNTNGIKFASLDLGQSIGNNGGTQGAGDNNALFSLNLLDAGKRRESTEIADSLRTKFANYQKGRLNVVEESGGPPAGADLQIKLLGDDLSILGKKADEVAAYLEKQPGVTNVDKSVKSGTSKLAFVPDKSLLAQQNIGYDQLGLWLRLYASGFKVASHKFPGDNKDRDVTLRLYPESAFANRLDQVILPLQAGGNIPLSSLGKLNLEENPTIITREDGKRTISVTAAVKRGFNVQDKNKSLESFANTKLALPEGYSWKTGGVNEENANSVQSILSAMLLSFLLIIVTMVLQFSSFRRALIVMLVIPLSISGVFIIFALTGTPLSFPALIGVLALFGIVVKNSILIVDKILENQKHNMTFIESISSASASRLEPIALTTFATILGLTPITLTDPLWRGLGGAIIAGLVFSGAIMLFFIPVVYFSWFNQKPTRK